MGWMDGRADSYGLSVRPAGGTIITSQRWFATPASVPRACLRVCMTWPPVRLCKAGMPPFFCCMLPFSCVPVVCAHVVSCIFLVPSTLPFLHAAPFLCVSVACVHVVSCIFPLLSCDVVILPFLCCMCDVVIPPFLCCMHKPPLGGARGAVPGPSLPPAAWSFGPLRRASGKYLTRHLTPLSTCQHACMINLPTCLYDSRPAWTVSYP